MQQEMERECERLRAAEGREYFGVRLVHHLLWISVALQRLILHRGAQHTALPRLQSWPVSTSARGLGTAEGSYQTPEGWHRVAERIGDGEPSGRVFRSREPQEIWEGEDVDQDLVLTRILWLEGLEVGHNRGSGQDSHDRYIYIHGTNRESEIGQAASKGCVRMRNADVLVLFEAIRGVETFVVIR